MHEVSLMQELLKVVEGAAEEQGGREVTKIHLKIGEMAGVNVESLRFAFEVLSRGTVAEDALLEFENIPLKMRCRSCNLEFSPVEFTFRCTACSGTDIEILAGREMCVDYILVNDER